jgi:hypothetical protein
MWKVTARRAQTTTRPFSFCEISPKRHPIKVPDTFVFFLCFFHDHDGQRSYKARTNFRKSSASAVVESINPVSESQ